MMEGKDAYRHMKVLAKELHWVAQHLDEIAGLFYTEEGAEVDDPENQLKLFEENEIHEE